MSRNYAVKKLSKLAGVSVRTLHHYDQIGLLKPTVRTEAGYRLYSENELIRLQQILFYKELDFPLKEIQAILDDPDFDVLKALKNHKAALKERKNRISTLLATIDKTILKIKGEQAMINDDDLYKGFPKEKAEAIRKEAMEKYGEEKVIEYENRLKKMSKADFESLQAEGSDIVIKLKNLMHLPVENPEVQLQIARHFKNIQQYWGASINDENKLKMYEGLAEMYVKDGRFYADVAPGFTAFISNAMQHFVKLKKQ